MLLIQELEKLCKEGFIERNDERIIILRGRLVFEEDRVSVKGEGYYYAETILEFDRGPKRGFNLNLIDLAERFNFENVKITIEKE